MKNIEDLAEEIKERDEACLSALCDVQTGKLEGEDEDGDEMVGFSLILLQRERVFHQQVYRKEIPHGRRQRRCGVELHRLR